MRLLGALAVGLTVFAAAYMLFRRFNLGGGSIDSDTTSGTTDSDSSGGDSGSSGGGDGGD